MKIIFSPTKTMDYSLVQGTTDPIYLNKAKDIWTQMKALNDSELQKIWHVSDKLFAKAKVDMLKTDFTRTSAALYSYQGLSFSYLDSNTLPLAALDYLNQHLCILSGLYGVLKPTDKIINYRLEMNYAKRFWQKELDTYFADDDYIINLASNEYSSILSKALSSKIYNIFFYKIKQGKPVQEATESKMLRGLCLRYLALEQITDLKEILNFGDNGYQYSPELSHENNIVFVKVKEN